jgi:hypothetical protein
VCCWQYLLALCYHQITKTALLLSKTAFSASGAEFNYACKNVQKHWGFTMVKQGEKQWFAYTCQPSPYAKAWHGSTNIRNRGAGFLAGALAKKHSTVLPERATERKLKSSWRRLKPW